MKKWCLAVLVLALASGSAWAAGDFGVRGGYLRIGDAEEGAGVVGGFIRWDWHEVFFVEGAVMYHEESFEGGDEDISVEMIPIQLSLLVFFLRRDLKFCPYLLGGGGMYVLRTVNESDDDSESDFDFGYHLGFGLDYMFNDRVYLEGDFRYVWLDADLEGETVKDSLASFDSWMAVAGIGFRL